VTEPSARTDRVSRASAIAVAAVVVLGLVLRFATRSDLWLDEALTVNVSRLPFSDIAPWLRHDGAPPLFYWLLHYWTDVFGTSDVAVRSLSGVFGVLSLPLAWACGRRLGGARLAWTTVVVLALNPFAVRYATETRMYGMEIFFVFAGILAVRRALERRSWDRLVIVAVLSAALVWSQYWCLSLVATVGATMLLVAWRSRDTLRANAIATFVAIAVGAATFAAWLPTFVEQSRHTGTPWAGTELPPGPIGKSILEFSGSTHSEGWLLVYVAVALLAIGTFGLATERRTIELSLHREASVLWEAAIGLAALALGATLAWIGHSGFQPRYAAIVFPMFVIVVARGITVLPTARVRAIALVFVVVCSLAGSLRNWHENRTQTGQVAAALATAARPGDLVIYCPDQLGPATHRLLARTPIGHTLREISYPLTLPYSHVVTRVDWYDYKKRLAATSPEAAAARAVLLVRPNQRVFVVTSPGYVTHDSLCPPFINSIVARTRRHTVELVAPDENIYEHAGLDELSTP
jgi:hypothetical protein